jgi:phage-related minor tail protein
VSLGSIPSATAACRTGLIAAVAAIGKPMVVVLEGGSIIKMPWLASVPAVVMAWYPGQMGGRALGKLLFGEGEQLGKAAAVVAGHRQRSAGVRQLQPAPP